MEAVRGCARRLCAGLYANVVRVQRPRETFHETLGGTEADSHHAKEFRFWLRPPTPTGGVRGQGETRAPRDTPVWLHPASVNFATGAYESPWLV